MRELGQFLIYLAGVACLFVGIAAGSSFMLEEYRSRPDAQSRTAPVESRQPELASAKTEAHAPSSNPVWITPTAKYHYVAPPPATVRPEATRQAATSNITRRTAKKQTVRERGDRSVASRVNGEARRAYGRAHEETRQETRRASEDARRTSGESRRVQREARRGRGYAEPAPSFSPFSMFQQGFSGW